MANKHLLLLITICCDFGDSFFLFSKKMGRLIRCSLLSELKSNDVRMVKYFWYLIIAIKLITGSRLNMENFLLVFLRIICTGSEAFNLLL